MKRATILLYCAIVLSSCAPPPNVGAKHAQFSGLEKYACYWAEGYEIKVEFVMTLDREADEIISLYGGKLIASKLTQEGDFYEVYEHQQEDGDQYFDIVQFDRKKGKLKHALAYFMSDSTYRESFGYKDTKSYSYASRFNSPELVSLIPVSPDYGNTVKIAWDKFTWTCGQIELYESLYYSIAELLWVIGSS